MFKQDLTPVSGSLTASALVALLPLITIFALLGVLRTKAHWAGLGGLAVAVFVGSTAFHMPAGLALLSGAEGAAFGLFPIMWIVVNALAVHHITVASGRFEDLRASFRLVTDDPRITAVLIAFCFGGLLEALTGFGVPVAITAVMLAAAGFPPFRAAVVVLIANTAPVAFGAVATPILTASALTAIPADVIGAVVGRQTPVLALFVPLILLGMVDGRRGIRQAWPVAVVCGMGFAAGQFVSSSYISVELTDIIASLVALGVTVVFLRIWRPAGTEDALRSLDASRKGNEEEAGVPVGAGRAEISTAVRDSRASAPALSRGRRAMALLPYAIIVAVFSIARLWRPARTFLTGSDVDVEWPRLHSELFGTSGKPITSTVYTVQWLSAPGTLLLVCGILVVSAYRVSPLAAARAYVATVHQLRWAFLTVTSLLAFAYVMDQSGQTVTIGTWIAGAGVAFAFLAPILGWLGAAVTGSDTASNALFATLQQAAGVRAGLNPTLLVAANTTGGAVGKMLSPVHLAIAASAVGIVGREGDLFRYIVKWSVGLILFLCVLICLQFTPALSWMLPVAPS
jgi:lactate permease